MLFTDAEISPFQRGPECPPSVEISEPEFQTDNPTINHLIIIHGFQVQYGLNNLLFQSFGDVIKCLIKDFQIFLF